MPLIKSKSPESFDKNLKSEMHAGKPLKQSLAIAYAVKRKAQQALTGGDIPCEHGGPEMCSAGCYDDGGAVTAKPSPTPSPSSSSAASDFVNSFNAATHTKTNSQGKTYTTFSDGGAVKSKRERALDAWHGKKMAQGGFIEDNYQSPKHEHVEDGGLDPKAHLALELKNEHMAHEGNMVKPNAAAMSEDERKLNQHGMIEIGPHDHYADGGFIEDNYQSKDHEMDMVRQVMKMRQQMFSQGGKVANENQGESASTYDHMAKAMPNEFDDLALRDDLEFAYTGANSGDENVDDSKEAERNEDTVSQVMKSRAKRSKQAISGYGRSDKQ